MSLFLSGFLLSMSLCLDLGIVNVATIKAGIEKGFLPALLIGFGSSMGDLIYALLAFAGISLLLQIEWVRIVLWVGGTAVLLYMTYGMLRATVAPKSVGGTEAAQRTDKPLWKEFIWGMGLALASPTAILWFMSIGGGIIAAHSMHAAGSMLLFFGGFFSASLAWSVIVASLSSQAGKRLGAKFTRAVSLVSAVLFLYFAVMVFADGYREWIAG